MEKKQVKISEIKSLIAEGLTRQEIKEKFGWNTKEAKLIFSHDKLKHLKPGSRVSVELIDDEEPPTNQENLPLYRSSTEERLLEEEIETIEEEDDLPF